MREIQLIGNLLEYSHIMRIPKTLKQVLRPIVHLVRGQNDARSGMKGMLRQLAKQQFSPENILDIGAARGEFTFGAHALFPKAGALMADPLTENQETLVSVCRHIPNAIARTVAVGAQEGTATFHVHADLVGSSLYLESDIGNVNGVPRTVPITTLDALVAQCNLKGPFLLKLDVQGAELDVIAGATSVLHDTECIIMEVVFFDYFDGGPRFHEVIDCLFSHGFVVYDIGGLHYRPLDGALSQVDIVFVRKDSTLRQHHVYANAAQRQRQFQKA